MTDKLTEKLVARAIALDREVSEKTDELKQIKKQLVELAQMDEDGQVRTENGGWSWTAQDRDGNVARVTTPAPSLKSSIPGEGDLVTKLRELAGKAFPRLFVQAPAYKLVPDFRDAVHLELGGREATKLIKSVTTKSAVQVAFETKEAA